MYPNKEPPVIEDKSAEVRRHYQTSHVAVLIPMLQAAVTGAFVALAVGVLARSWVYAFVAFSVIAAITWLLLLSGWRSLVYRLEAALGVDLDHDDFVGDPEPARVRIELVEKGEGGHRTQFVDLDCDPSKLADLARSLMAGASFSEAQFSGAGALFSRRQFRAVRDEFLKRGWVAWRNESAPAQGLELTRTGAAVVRHFASMTGEPPTLKARAKQNA